MYHSYHVTYRNALITCVKMVTLNTMKTQYFLDIHADVLANQNAIATYIGPPNDMLNLIPLHYRLLHCCF